MERSIPESRGFRTEEALTHSSTQPQQTGAKSAHKVADDSGVRKKLLSVEYIKVVGVLKRAHCQWIYFNFFKTVLIRAANIIVCLNVRTEYLFCSIIFFNFV